MMDSVRSPLLLAPMRYLICAATQHKARRQNQVRYEITWDFIIAFGAVSARDSLEAAARSRRRQLRRVSLAGSHRCRSPGRMRACGRKRAAVAVPAPTVESSPLAATP